MPRLYQAVAVPPLESLPARTKPAAESLAPRIIWKIAGRVPSARAMEPPAPRPSRSLDGRAVTGTAVAVCGEAGTAGAGAAVFRVRFSHAAAVFAGS